MDCDTSCQIFVGMDSDLIDNRSSKGRNRATPLNTVSASGETQQQLIISRGNPSFIRHVDIGEVNGESEFIDVVHPELPEEASTVLPIGTIDRIVQSAEDHVILSLPGIVLTSCCDWNFNSDRDKGDILESLAASPFCMDCRLRVPTIDPVLPPIRKPPDPNDFG